MIAGLKFMHLHKWLHCDIHWQNVLLHFLSWDWDETKARAESGRDDENKLLSPLIRRSLVFVGFGDLGWAQSFEEVRKDFDPYPMSDPNPQNWFALELNPKLDFFTDMTDEEKREYNRAVYTRGLNIPNAAEVHGRLLREGLEKMTWKKICPKVHPDGPRRFLDDSI
ncbi:hypothetical protein R1sor_025516 [Riccia sorocarpa]|uniref:Protein kinase domain-containing protein n=1 Tax=Riccia sorocarpa TaxID=122646 RepID=A0ABD3G8U6_9MARC